MMLQMSKANCRLLKLQEYRVFVADSQDDNDNADEICPLVRAVMHLIKIVILL